MKNYPQYLRLEREVNGELITEWIVRLYKKQIDDENGKKIPTPKNLLNRYYKISNFIPLNKSVFKGRMYITYEAASKENITLEVND